MTDKIEHHYLQQLSALVDGDLPADEARFLLRRLQHDEELATCLERWQLCGDVLRGQASAPAPAGFAERVALAVAAEPALAAATRYAPGRGRLVRWGGGALAASVAAIALFVARQQAPEEVASEPAPAVAAAQGSGGSAAQPATTVNDATAPAVAASTAAAGVPAQPGPQPDAASRAATLAAAGVAVASVVPRQSREPRRSATRTRQAVRASTAAAVADAPQQAVASAAAPPLPVLHRIAPEVAVSQGPALAQRDPFSDVQLPSASARPWPRAVLPQYPADAALSTRYPGGDAATFYPFDPRLPTAPPLTLPAGAVPQEP